MTTTDGPVPGSRASAPERAGIGGLGDTPRPLADLYDVALLDLDGVVYLDGQAIPTARSAVAGAVERGMRFAFVTNNASRTPRRIAAQLNEMGVPARPPDVVTSAQAAARLVADRVPPESAVLVTGAMGLRHAVRQQGLQPVSSAAHHPVAVVQGYHPQMPYGLLAEAALAVRDGALYVASNADTTMPTPRGPVPGNGSLIRVVATATGQEPLVAGKPQLPLHREAVLRTGAERPLVVGDRLDTDIEGAVRAGTPSMLVLTGSTDPATVVAAPPHARPTFLARDLGGLLEAQPEVRPDDEGWSCGGWHASNRHGRLRTRRIGDNVDETRSEAVAADDPYDGLRALCAAAWQPTRTRQPLDQKPLQEALRTLGFG